MTKFKLRGSRVLLSQPEIKEPVIELSPEGKKAFDEEQMKLFTEIEVFAVGDAVESVKAGDKIYISPQHLQYAQLIEVEGATRLLVREQDIDIIW